jgi:hypothetical protein
VGLAFGHLEQKQLTQALAWVEEYAESVPENLLWPVVKGYLTAAKVKARHPCPTLSSISIVFYRRT